MNQNNFIIIERQNCCFDININKGVLVEVDSMSASMDRECTVHFSTDDASAAFITAHVFNSDGRVFFGLEEINKLDCTREKLLDDDGKIHYRFTMEGRLESELTGTSEKKICISFSVKGWMGIIPRPENDGTLSLSLKEYPVCSQNKDLKTLEYVFSN